jgi:serine/threonine protein kinase
LKLENILIEDTGRVKIIDFGFAVYSPDDRRLKNFCGTPSYMAPEIVLKQEYFGTPTDIWACGVLLYALFCGALPFRSESF